MAAAHRGRAEASALGASGASEAIAALTHTLHTLAELLFNVAIIGAGGQTAVRAHEAWVAKTVAAHASALTVAIFRATVLQGLAKATSVGNVASATISAANTMTTAVMLLTAQINVTRFAHPTRITQTLIVETLPVRATRSCAFLEFASIPFVTRITNTSRH